MKKLTALLLALAMLCICACAMAEEESIVLETETMDGLIGGTLLTESSISEAVISPYSASDLFAADKKDPWYVTFPVPAGCRVTSFGVQTFTTMDMETYCQYVYQAMSRYTFEDFLLDCKDENYRVLDGSDGVAGYVNPGNSSGYILFGLGEIDTGAKLYLRIFDYSELRELHDAGKAARLTELVQAEAARLKESLACVKAEAFWTDGRIGSLKLYSRSVPGEYINAAMPEASFHLTEGSVQGRAFVTGVDGNSFNLYVAQDRANAVEIDCEVNTYAYVYSRDESEITKVTLSDGCEWGIYVANERDGRPYSVYAAKVLNPGEENPVYFSVQMKTVNYGVEWPDVEAFAADLDAVAAAFTFE